MSLRELGQATALALSVSVGCFFAPSAQAQPVSSAAYSADFTFETAELAQTGRIYASAGKERRETVMEGMTMISIRRDDLEKMWLLMPAEQMYMEIDMGQAGSSDMAAPSPADYEVEMTEVGPETLDGVETTKQKVIMTGTDGSKMGGFWWLTADEIPIKMDMIAIDQGEKLRLKQQLTNLVPGEPDPSLFEVPEGYQNMGGFGMGIPGMPTDE